MSDFPFVLRSKRIVAIDPFASHTLSPHNSTVGPSLRVWTVVSAGPKSGCLNFDLLLNVFTLLSVFNGQFHFAKNKRDEFVLLLQCSFPSFAFIQFIRQPISWPSHPTHFHDCAITVDGSILCGLPDLVSVFLFVGSATILYFSTYRLF